MSDLAHKLGLKEGLQVCLLEAPPEAEAAMRSAAPPGVQFSSRLEEGCYDMILFWPQKLEGLAELFSALQGQIVPTGAVWAVMPKKKFAPARGVTFTWEELQAAGLQTDLVDNKIASITEQDYGTRFVIRKERRR
jgi:hypothetical protein